MPTFEASSYASSSFDPSEMFQASVMASPVRSAGRPILNVLQPMERENMAAAVGRRIVKVFISDPNENLSLEQCLLYKGDEKVTDLNDQELFFELDIRSMLEEHNKKRTQIVDKRVKDRTEYLEAAKIRDLKMTVVTVANL